MRVEDIISITGEETTVVLVDLVTSKIASKYNGKDSIDPQYNPCKVKNLAVENNALFIFI